MKLLHTSDWHLGQEFYSYDRTEEHISFLTQLEQIVEKEQPDVLAISGDIYHNATPSNAVMRLFTDHLDSIRNACKTMKIVVIAGNHDSSSRLEVSQTLWKHLGVYVIGKIEKEEECVNFDKHIIPISNAEGLACGYVVALPYIASQAYPSLIEGTPREERQTVFLKSLADHLTATNKEQLPVVMMAHMALTGSDITGHDQIQGGLDYTNISDLMVDFDYLALGHIHCPQTIHHSANLSCARYCGSPIPVSFDERYVHSVSVVEINKKGERPVVRTIPISNPWPLKTIPAEPVDFEEALHLLSDFPNDEKAYLRLNVKLSDVAPSNAMERAMISVKDKKCRFCCFRWDSSAFVVDKKKTFVDIDQMKSRSPLEIAELYYESKYGKELDDDLKNMLSEVIKQVQHKSDIK